MPQFTAAKRGMLAANPQQFLDVRENLLLFARTPGLRKRVVRIADPSPRKITAIVRIASSRHSNFIAVVNLRNASQGQRQSEGQLQFRRGTAFGARETRYVMIRKHRHE